MPFHSLTNFKMQNYYQDEPSSNGVCSRNIYLKWMMCQM